MYYRGQLRWTERAYTLLVAHEVVHLDFPHANSPWRGNLHVFVLELTCIHEYVDIHIDSEKINSLLSKKNWLMYIQQREECRTVSSLKW